MARDNHQLVTTALVVVAMALTMGLGSTSLAGLADLRAYDFFSRHHRSATDVTNVLMVLVDDRSREVIRDPLVDWDSHYADLIRGAHANGAKAIAFDVIFALDDDHARPQGRRELAQAILDVSSAGTPVVLGIDVGAGAPSSSLYLPALATGSIGTLNLGADPDETIRRVRLCSSSTDPDLRTLAAATIQATGMTVACAVDRSAPLLIEYAGPAYTVPHVSFADALSRMAVHDPALRKAFEGKLVFIGTDDNQDRHATPFAAGDARSPGVEIHSTLAAMLLSGQSRTVVKPWWIWTFALLSATLSVILGMRMPWTPAVALSILLLLASPAAAWVLWSRWLWLPFTVPMLGVLAGAGPAMLMRYRAETRARQKLRKHFAQYVPASVIDQLGEVDMLGLAGKRVRVAVLFSDIRGFTTISERSAPETLVKQLNEYLSVMTGIVHAHHGIVDKFIGDGILAVFGAPLVTPEPAFDAVSAAGDMLERLEVLNREWERDSLPRFAIGIGIHFGDVIVGNVGSPLKMEYTVIGDTVNTAARIESQTKESIERCGVHVLISEAVVNELQRLNRPVDAELMAEQQLKGKQESTRLYLLRTGPRNTHISDAAVKR